ncbi:hypothetical protein P153DRAFT_307284 [Dothidotthia symphoricarpi CBS 119687]|uniref:DUF7707 domain-containing protein n=1 Tax=Dothidotthia symphoricarpi CBS 119687 TaxID=1392245 RepID=A0A6A6AQN0_9PLEO|nr:uncharacterized protein P153DRAFT_307284 [Dothidotthia symphoricarpi CBS 119687]KAF2134249.1 hypothetical protein P153DRAFT_307284 [Dothidotthia symphoricarpi CBS 119687]
MLYSTLVVAASAFAGLASAQNTTYSTPIACCTVAAGSVPTDQKTEWCNANQNTCVDLCGGQGSIASNGNECDATTLDYTCKCSNGTDITDSMAIYQQTVPAQMCFYWYGVCIQATGTNAAQQFQCNEARDNECGNLTIGEDASSSSSASASSTASRTSGAVSSATSAAASAAASAAGASTLGQYGLPALAGGLMAIFGLAL